MRSLTLLLSAATVNGLSKKPMVALETSLAKQSKSPSDHPSGGVPETIKSGICGRNSWTRSKVSRPDAADLNLLSAMNRSGGSAWQAAMASSGASAVMTRYSGSSMASKTVSEVRSSSKISAVFKVLQFGETHQFTPSAPIVCSRVLLPMIRLQGRPLAQTPL